MQCNSARIEPSLSRFRQIVETLRQEIVSGRLDAHAALPSERALAETHGVSRMTARRALEAIEAEGLAYSQGRRGRFVSPRRVTYDITRQVSFAADTLAAGAELDITVIGKGTKQADSRLAAALSVDIDRMLHQYTRLFRIGRHAMLIETEYVVADLCPDLLDHDLRQSTTLLLERGYGIIACSADLVIRMRATQPSEAELLGLAPFQAGIELEQVIRDRTGSPFCFGQQIWRGELAQFTARAQMAP